MRSNQWIGLSVPSEHLARILLRFRTGTSSSGLPATLKGDRYHQALKTRNWEDAQKKRNKIETEGEQSSKTIQEATDSFIRDAEARGLRTPSVYKYKLIFKQLHKFATDKGLRLLTQCDIETLRLFRESWPNKNFSARKKLEALRTFFKFVHNSGWLPTNPATLIKPPKVNDPPTLPYTKEEVERVLAACDQYRVTAMDKQYAQKLRALTLFAAVFRTANHRRCHLAKRPGPRWYFDPANDQNRHECSGAFTADLHRVSR